jgi:chromosome segregation ATPase
MAEYETHMFSNLQENIEKIVLENITSVTLNTEVLKVNFEAIVSILKGLSKRMDQSQDSANQTDKDLRSRLEKLEDKQSSDKIELTDKIFNNQQHIQTVQDKTNQNTQDIQALQESIRELKDNQAVLNKISENDLNNIKEKLERHDNQIQELLNKIAENGNRTYPADLNGQISDIHKLLEDFVKKDEFNDHKLQTNNHLQNHQNSIDDLYCQLKDLKALTSSKLNCETFDEHLADYNNIKNLVISLANNNGDQKNIIQSVVQSGPSLSTKDMNLLKELGQRFPEIENLIKKIQKDLNDHLLSYKSFTDEITKKVLNSEENLKNFKIEINKRIAELEASFNSLRDQLLSLNSSSSSKGSGESSADLRKIQIALGSLAERVNILEEKINHLQEASSENKNKINMLEEELIDLKTLKARIEMLEQLLREREKDSKDQGHKTKGSKGGSFENGGGVTLEQVKQIVDDEISKLRDEIMAILEELKNLIDKKADAEDLMKSEAALLEKLDQIAGALMKRAQADKNDTKKALMFLEKKINEISLIVLGGPSNSEEGAIFAKKPWAPWSCASCDSKLKDYPGPLIDHKNWNKLPQREISPGRMTQGKFGKGWSKWVDNKRMTVEKSRDPFSSPSQKLGEALPEIQRDGRNPVDSSRLNE